MTMTMQTIRDGLNALKKYVVDEGRRAPSNATVEGARTQILHLTWMIDEALGWPDESREKAMRWLCFAQGVLWANGIVTIDEMKVLNKGAVEPPDH